MMMRSDPVEDYREWLFDIIRFDDYCDRYERLLDYLSGVEFTWLVDHDCNRAEDGFALRWKFASENYVDEDFWIDRLPVPCSVLEMMIALSMRCEDIVFDPDQGCQVAKWFWKMVKNIGLGDMSNTKFDKAFCDICVDGLLKRRYCRNGKGGLFRTKRPKIDMRKSEIWYQMNVWLEENFDV